MIDKFETNRKPWNIPSTRKPAPHDCCPDCGEEFHQPKPDLCVCRKPMLICIPPGKHIHINCPVHGDVKLYGPRATFMSAMVSNN